MTTVTIAVKASKDGSLTIPRLLVESLGMQPGDDAYIRVATEVSQVEDLDQDELQAGLDRFFEHLDTIQLEKPNMFPAGDKVEKGFVEIMDRKYQRLGFKP